MTIVGVVVATVATVDIFFVVVVYHKVKEISLEFSKNYIHDTK